MMCGWYYKIMQANTFFLMTTQLSYLGIPAKLTKYTPRSDPKVVLSVINYGVCQIINGAYL